MFEHTYLDLLYIVSCEINQVKPDCNRIKEMDLVEVHRLAKKHLLVVISYMGIESSGILNDEAWMADFSETALADIKKWKQEKEKGVRKNLLLDIERQKLFEYFEKEHIWYMPLKGSVLKDSYPCDGMRQMADNDILFDASMQEHVKEYFEKEGFEVFSYKEGNHDIYEKKPIYNFEMHISLFEALYNSTWYDYYASVKDKLMKDDDREYGYHFSDNDFYIYFVTHTCKHHVGCGTGIRSLLDCYVYQTSRILDWSYIEREMEKLGIAEFEKVFRSASHKLFAPEGGIDTLTEKEIKLVKENALAGTYGTQKNGIENKLHKLQNDEKPIKGKTKWKYYLNRFFPSKDYYMAYHPTVYKLKFVIPFFLVYRVIKGLIVHSKKLFMEAKMVWKADK